MRDISFTSSDFAIHYKKERDFWLNKLSGEIAKSIFPYDNIYFTSSAKELKTMGFTVDWELAAGLLNLSKSNDYALHVILVAALVVLLEKYTGNNDIMVGTPIYKQEVEAEFINTMLVLRNHIKEDMSFRELLVQVKQTLVEADENQNYPIEKLVKDLDLVEVEEDFPLFDVVIILKNLQDESYFQHIRPNIIFSFLRAGENIEGVVKYNPARYEIVTIGRVIRHFLELLRKFLADSSVRIADSEILSTDEREQLLFGFNDTRTNYYLDMMLHRLFAQQAEQIPDHTALKGQIQNSQSQTPNTTISITYKELNQQSNQVAQLLKQKGVQSDTIVGIMAERSLEMVIGILGILKAGGAYLPIDHHYPANRIHYMLADSKAKVLLAEPQAQVKEEFIEIIDISNLSSPSTSAPTSPLSQVNPANLAYIIYTSGSTGKPKGVLVEHISVVNILWALQKSYPLMESDVYLFKTAYGFDVSVTEIFGWFFGSGRLTILEKGGEKDPGKILEAIERERVSHINFVPSMFNAFTSALNHGNIGKLSSLKYIFLAGEALSTEMIDKFMRVNTNTQIELENIYGPTEGTIYSSSYSLSDRLSTDSTAAEPGSIPIGKPMPNTRLYILDNNFRLQPVGVPGELCIAGTGLARGYLNNPELTSEKFCLRQPGDSFRENRPLEDPRKSFLSNYSPLTTHHSPIYKTGDLARWLPDGNIQFLGRRDNQVKIRGFRIEMGEIENRLKKFKKIHDAKPIQDEDIEKANNLKSISRCKKCLLPKNTSEIGFNEEGVCSVCQQYESVAEHVQNYFKDKNDFLKLITEIRRTSGGRNEYDCLLLFSGGKDSSYVLYRLHEMGLKVLTYTLDNGYISETALENIEKIASRLNVDHLVDKPENMNKVFVESLRSSNNVCPGCWHALNTCAGKTAHEKGIPLVISALSRPQIVDTRLYGLFQGGIFNEKEIEEKLLLFRKRFHSKDNKFSRTLNVALEEEVVEQIQFVDFFRYFDTPALQIKDYLSKKGWIQPEDTGCWSSDCKIKDVGIFMHHRNFGFHFYDLIQSWACRLGEITRKAAVEKIAFKADLQNITGILKEIGYYSPITIKDAVVIDKEDQQGNKFLCGYFTSEDEINALQLKDYLSRELPAYMIPNYFVKIERVPLTPSGKLNRSGFPEPSSSSSTDNYVPPGTREEKILVELWSTLLNVEKVGIHDNFFSWGGDSILSILVVSQAEARGLKFTTQQLFQYPTIHGLLENLKGNHAATNQPVVSHDSQPFGLIGPEDRQKIPGGIEDAYPLRMLQIDFLSYLQEIYGNPLRRMIDSFIIKKPFDRHIFEKVVQGLVKRHPVLRTKYDLQNFSQYLHLIHEEVPLPIEIKDLRGLSGEEQEKLFRAAEENELKRDYSMEKAGLIRFVIHILDDEKFHYMTSYHISIMDGWSTMLLLTELYQAYDSLLSGKEWSWGEGLDASFRDMVTLELEILKSGEAKKFWREWLTGSRFTRIPRQAFAHSQKKHFQAAVYTLPFSADLSGKLKEAAFLLEVPIKSILLTAHCVVLSMLSGNPDIVTGYEVNGRPEKKDGEKIIGIFINVIPFRLKIAGGTWSDLIKESYQRDIELLPYRRYSLTQLKMDLGRQQFFEAVFNFAHFREYRKIADLEAEDMAPVRTRTDLMAESEYVLRAEFRISPITDQVDLFLYYHAYVFPIEQMKLIYNCYIRVLRHLSGNPMGPCEMKMNDE